MPSHRLFLSDEDRTPKPLTIRMWNDFRVVAIINLTPTGFTISGPASPLSMTTAVDIEMDPWAALIRVVSVDLGDAAQSIVSFIPSGPFDDEPPF